MVYIAMKHLNIILILKTPPFDLRNQLCVACATSIEPTWLGHQRRRNQALYWMDGHPNFFILIFKEFPMDSLFMLISYCAQLLLIVANILTLSHIQQFFSRRLSKTY